MTIQPLDSFTVDRRQLSRIRVALWREASIGDPWWVPPNWHPDPVWVAVIDLKRVAGLSTTSREVVRIWLKANGLLPPD